MKTDRIIKRDCSLWIHDTVADPQARTSGVIVCPGGAQEGTDSHGAGLLRGVPGAQLPVVAIAQALDPATRLDRARVRVPQGDGGGGDAWGQGGVGRAASHCHLGRRGGWLAFSPPYTSPHPLLPFRPRLQRDVIYPNRLSLSLSIYIYIYIYIFEVG
jgi:hypothetical protein